MVKLTGAMMADAPTEASIEVVDKLVAEAYKEIDKAVSKGVLHKNNGARKKSRVARYKRMLQIKAGLWTPPNDHPDHKKLDMIMVSAHELSALRF